MSFDFEDFEPVRLDPRRRRIDPVMVGVVAVIVAIAAAVIKPWDAKPADEGTSPAAQANVSQAGAGASTAPSPASASSDRPAESIVAGLAPPTWDEIAPFVGVHRAWGIRAILLDPVADSTSGSPRRFVERWVAASTAGAGVSTAFVETDERSIIAMGITAPPDRAPLDVRIWQLHADDRLEWIDAQPVQPAAAGGPRGAFLFVRSAAGGAGVTSWDTGHYRIDVLTSEGIHRIGVDIPGRFGHVPAPHDLPAESPGLVPPAAADPSRVQAGMFATVDGMGVPLAAAVGPLLDETGAWFATDGGRAPVSGSVVATSFHPRATGLGVMLPSGSALRSATVLRLAPDVGFNVAPETGGGISSLHSRVPYVVFRAPGDGAWSPGVYAISVTWADGAGPHTGAWHVELRPGPFAAPS